MYPIARMRVSNAERDVVIARLTAACSEGRLSLPEFEERASRAYNSRTWAELNALTLDLPPANWRPPGLPREPVTHEPLDTVALTLGIIAVPMAVCVGSGGLFGLAAVILGALGLTRAKRTNNPHTGYALSGVILGSIGLALSIGVLLYLLLVDTTA